MHRIRSRGRVVELAAAAALAALATTACASGGAEMPQSQSGFSDVSIDGALSEYDLRLVTNVSPQVDTVDAIVEEVWNALPQAYVAVGVPIGGVNPEARLLGNKGFRVYRELGDHRVSDFLSCGRSITGSNADQLEVHLSVVSQLEETGGKTLVSTLVRGFAQPQGVSGNPIRCSSTGDLESDIVTRIRTALVGIE